MIRVTANSDDVVFDTARPSLSLEKLTVGKELNKADTAEFVLPPDHELANWDNFEGVFVPYKSLIRIWSSGGPNDDPLLFRGRVISRRTGFTRKKTVVCEGEQAFLSDTVAEAQTMTGTLRNIFSQLVSSHNSQTDAFKRFTVGSVTIISPDTTPSLELKKAQSTARAIAELIKKYGGYLTFGDGANAEYRVINWVGALSEVCSQTVEFGKNLLDLAVVTQNKDFANRIIPYGKEIDGQRVTISVNGHNYVEDANSQAAYGIVAKVMYFDDAEDAATLLIRANSSLEQSKNIVDSISVSALDLAELTRVPGVNIDTDVTRLAVGTVVHIDSPPHGIDASWLITARTFDLLKKQNGKITLGGAPVSLTGQLAAIGGIK